MKTKILAVANIIFFAATLVVNYLANYIPIGWMDTGQLSDLYPSLFVPAWFTFSIWWIIYLLLLGFIIWQFVDIFKKDSLWITQKIGPWFIVSSLANIAWIFAWHYTYVGLSLIIMLLILASLIVISYKVEIGKKIWSWEDKLLIQIPFSVYLWWISVATIANVSTFLIDNNRAMFGMTDVFRTIVVIVVAAFLGLLALYQKNNIPYALVILWAFYWIYSKRVDVDPIYAANILVALQLCSVVLVLVCGMRLKKWLKN